MRVVFKDVENEKIIFRTDDSNIIPDVGESIVIENRLYKVEKRTFYYDERKMPKQNLCSLLIKEEQQ